MPGPDFSIVTRNSVVFGRRTGVFMALGIGIGISFHIAYTIAGFGAIALAQPLILLGLQILGAGYLLYLAYDIITADNDSDLLNKTSDDAPHVTAQLSDFSAFKRGFLTNVLNPKVTMFFLAIFTTIVSTETSLITQVFYGVWIIIVTAGWFIFVATFFSNTIIRDKFLKNKRPFELTMAIILIIFALSVIVSIL